MTDRTHGSGGGNGYDLELAPFDFTSRTRVIYGAGSLAQLGPRVRELGGSRVLLVTDPGLEAAGHPTRALASLTDADLTAFVFDGVEENPTTEHVERGLAVATEHRIDFLVAIGGGSAMDCAKGINFLFTNGGRMHDYVGIGKASKPMLPSLGIPTTAGTGSEAQSFSLVADPSTHAKMACGDPKAAFRAAILDPEVTVSQPPRVTALTAIDAISHSIETFVCNRRNAVSRMYSAAAWRLLNKNIETVLRDPADLAARGAMQIGAHFAGAAIENSMLGACHSCANPLTAHYGLTHGLAIGIMLPYVIRFNAPVAAESYAILLGNGAAEAAAADSLAERIQTLLRTAALPTSLSACGIPRSVLPVLADEAVEQWTARFNPRPVSRADLLRLYEMAS
jgi:alcohol dehydrogenase class IV